jgi:hypothetical protein
MLPIHATHGNLRPVLYVTGKAGMYEFVLKQPMKCPQCHFEVTEKTLVAPGGLEVDTPTTA